MSLLCLPKTLSFNVLKCNRMSDAQVIGNWRVNLPCEFCPSENFSVVFPFECLCLISIQICLCKLPFLSSSFFSLSKLLYTSKHSCAPVSIKTKCAGTFKGGERVSKPHFNSSLHDMITETDRLTCQHW